MSTTNPITAVELQQEARRLTARAKEVQTAVSAARTALRNCQPFYQEPVEAYAARRASLAASLAVAEENAQAAPLHARVSGPSGLALTPEEWQTAATLAPLAEQRAATARLTSWPLNCGPRSPLATRAGRWPS